MSATPAQAFSFLRQLARSGELAELCRTLGIELMVVFGSVLDLERADAARDLDVAVLLNPAGGADEDQVGYELSNLLACEEIDLLDLARAAPAMQERALVGTVTLHEQTPGTLATLRDRAILLRMETDWQPGLDLENTGS